MNDKSCYLRQQIIIMGEFHKFLNLVQGQKPALLLKEISQENRFMSQALSTFKFNSYTTIGKQEEKKLAQIVNNLIDIPEATDFLHPVAWKELELEDYLQVIRHPMNLYKVQQKLKARQFNTVEQVLDLIQLIWDNCKQYNKEGHYFQLAEKMEKIFRKMIKNYLPSVIYAVVQRVNPIQSQQSTKRQSFINPPLMSNRVIQKVNIKPTTNQKSVAVELPEQEESKSQKAESQQQAQVEEIPLTEKNRFHQRLRQITQQDLAQIVLVIQQYSADAFKHISGPRYQIHVDSIDTETFKKLSDKLDELIENQKICNGNPTKKLKI